MLTLEVKVRDSKESADDIRKKGLVPAIFYGRAEAATPISVDALKFDRVFREAGETTIVTLKGGGIEKDTLIHDVQMHPVTGKPLHADFYVLEKGKKITIKIPLEFEGAAPAEKLGHIIVKALHEVEIEVAPQELPKSLAVDLSKLENVGDHILASQIELPPSATLLTGADEIVTSVTEFKEEKLDEPPTPVVPAEVEGAAPAEDGEEAAPAEAPEEKKD
ncbi:MAG TPA: 50S ribosomal protein L25 [Candidatus Paceibacterota bacterium]|jgi:large subunit ribosomal protein L25|nr:50S ribosomal protein L25 [Candidatus Paceibacterota bacterium]